MKSAKKILCGLSKPRRAMGVYAATTDLNKCETQDNVSMHNFKNTLTAFERQVGRGESSMAKKVVKKAAAKKAPAKKAVAKKAPAKKAPAKKAVAKKAPAKKKVAKKK